MKLIFLAGLPACGKTSWAKEYQKNNPGTKRVNKDDLRSMIDDSVWSKSNEKTILSIQQSIVSDLLNKHDVILDNTHLDKKHEKEYREICLDNGYLFEYKFFDVDVEECIRRDKKRANPVGAKVILDMYNRYLRPEPVKVEFDESLPTCIICDIDGTLAEKGERSPYDYSKVHLDTIIDPVADMVDENFRRGITVFILSGREDSCREQTEKWLDRNCVNYNGLYMRKAGDKREDSIIKKEIYEQHIKGKYNVKYVVDDRKRVKRMWVEQGLFVLDCNQFDIEF